MKRLPAIILAVLLSACLPCRSAFAAGAYGPQHDSRAIAEEILSRLGQERVQLRYSCTVDSGTKLDISGTLVAQGECYRAEGNGLVIISNGELRWTVDPAAKEVYIEHTSGVEEVLSYRDSLVELELSDVQYLPQTEDSSEFSFDCSALDGEWIVTDLRGE